MSVTLAPVLLCFTLPSQITTARSTRIRVTWFMKNGTEGELGSSLSVTGPPLSPVLNAAMSPVAPRRTLANSKASGSVRASVSSD